MERVATDVRAVTIARSGHYPAEERHAQLARALSDFFGDVADSSRQVRCPSSRGGRADSPA